MKTLRSMIRRHATWERWQFLYIILSLSWLLAPGNNPALSAHTTYISEFENPGQPWSWLYLGCDIAAALVLGLAVFVIVRRRRGFDLSTSLLAVIAAGSFIDATFPSGCSTHNLFCLMPEAVAGSVHAVESVITTCAVLALNLLWVRRKQPWSLPVLLVQVAWAATFLIGRFWTHGSSTFAQFAYEIIIILWLAQVVPAVAGHVRTASRKRESLLLHVITAWVFFGGFLTIVNAVRNVREISEHSAVYFGDNTAWLSQHGVVVGIVLLYVSRHLWRGEYRAWQLTSALLWLEALKYAVLSPNALLAALYGVTAALLFTQRAMFDRRTSAEVLRERIKKLLGVLLVAFAALIVGLIAFRLKHHQDLDSLKVNPTHFLQHLFLIDIVNDLGPLPRRLVGQVLNAAGLALLFAVLVSLFKPQEAVSGPDNESERERLLGLLAGGSTSSEDFFKYWPRPKAYWRDTTGDAMVAYRVEGNVAFALADPIARSPAARKRALQEFLAYTRSHGWLACFLMVDDRRAAQYRGSGYKLLRIGASANVDITTFSDRTSRNKWWRWVLNKAQKQGWEYELALPPHSPARLAAVRQISDEWLGRQHHVERGFALGYFDESYLQQCRLHLLKDRDGALLAFANELPTYNGIPTSTIDLMRFLPDRGHVMPALLAHTIRQLHEEGSKRTFDLGFVPLASPSARGEQIISQLGRFLLSEAVSAQGLEQFKNKFEPDWIDNYIAFDGDWIDLVHISRQVERLLKVSESD